MPPRASALWFPDVPPSPASDATPAADLAAHLARYRSVGPAQVALQPSAVAVLERPVPMLEKPVRPVAAAPQVVAPRPASELDAFLAEAEKSVRAKRKSGSAARGEKPARLGSPLRIAGAAAAILVIVATALGVVLTRGGEPASTTASTSTADASDSLLPSTSAVASEPVCTQRPVGSGTTVSDGDDAGNQESGAGAIRAFNHAYYVLRSARAARAAAAPGAVASEYVMQQYINQRPLGTRHCLTVAERGPGEYSVVLTELQPDAAPITYRQVIRTTTIGGKSYIQSIRSVE
ncbi:hypothetical protein [Gordonia sp. (in: high G+C Gram-positive bacteria)]|uniref:hypothetical protein n=1 Tax=Gordonia sp. (in: high G+C Gram-positive bacteria) TaxID=84139 RepID=UPI0035B2BA6D